MEDYLTVRQVVVRKVCVKSKVMKETGACWEEIQNLYYKREVHIKKIILSVIVLIEKPKTTMFLKLGVFKHERNEKNSKNKIQKTYTYK
jgi:hypothetical protein